MAIPIEMYAVKDLSLDPQNPRLPEQVQGKSQSEILRFLLETGNLEELAQSFLDNGFFSHEPVIVLKQEKGKHIVLEGNRRLATLMILQGVPEAEGLTFDGVESTPAHLKALEEIPGYAIHDREEVHRYLGFRHIGGIKAWEPEAKARYLLGEVDRAAADGNPDPFKEVGRRVGSNALGVRNPYIAILILRFAREEFGIDVGYVQRDRFGVWLRCMNSKDLRRYIGLGDVRTYPEVREAVPKLHQARLREVIADLTPQPGHKRALLVDSRDVTDYGRILADARARETLRKHEDISVARQVIDELSLPARIRRLMESCRLVLDEIQLTEEVSEELKNAAEDLERVAGSLSATVSQRLAKAKKK